jgi:hypothetical protein
MRVVVPISGGGCCLARALHGLECFGVESASGFRVLHDYMAIAKHGYLSSPPAPFLRQNVMCLFAFPVAGCANCHSLLPAVLSDCWSCSNSNNRRFLPAWRRSALPFFLACAAQPHCELGGHMTQPCCCVICACCTQIHRQPSVGLLTTTVAVMV